MNFNDEQLRQSENLAMAYDAWVENERRWRAHKPRLQWKSVAGNDYLYRITDRNGNGTSLGPRSPELEQHFEDYSTIRRETKDAGRSLKERLIQVSRVCRALHLPSVASTAGDILREADVLGMLGSEVMTVGTNALIAYAYAGGVIPPTELQSTADMDMAWAADREILASGSSARSVFGLLKSVDSTFTINTERTFQARNSEAFEVELLAAPSVYRSFPRTEPMRPLDGLAEQEWLLNGRQLREVVLTLGPHATALCAPDPRWFALHKQWLADKPGRNRRKVAKDRAQGQLVWHWAREGRFPLHVVDEDFLADLPEPLEKYVHSET